MRRMLTMVTIGLALLTPSCAPPAYADDSSITLNLPCVTLGDIDATLGLKRATVTKILVDGDGDLWLTVIEEGGARGVFGVVVVNKGVFCRAATFGPPPDKRT